MESFSINLLRYLPRAESKLLFKYWVLNNLCIPFGLIRKAEAGMKNRKVRNKAIKRPIHSTAILAVRMENKGNTVQIDLCWVLKFCSVTALEGLVLPLAAAVENITPGMTPGVEYVQDLSFVNGPSDVAEKDNNISKPVLNVKVFAPTLQNKQYETQAFKICEGDDNVYSIYPMHLGALSRTVEEDDIHNLYDSIYYRYKLTVKGKFEDKLNSYSYFEDKLHSFSRIKENCPFDYIQTLDIDSVIKVEDVLRGTYTEFEFKWNFRDKLQIGGKNCPIWLTHGQLYRILYRLWFTTYNMCKHDNVSLDIDDCIYANVYLNKECTLII